MSQENVEFLTNLFAEVSSRIYIIVTFRGEKILRYQEFYDEQDALAAVER
jgi:ketosteroid isomerase-like protein